MPALSETGQHIHHRNPKGSARPAETTQSGEEEKGQVEIHVDRMDDAVSISYTHTQTKIRGWHTV